nr:hypothetical protein [Tanacetum cinerariifolium]
MVGVDINTLTMEQYLTLLQENQEPGAVKPEMGGNVNFEIKSQLMRELREDTFVENKNEDAHDHVDRVLNIVSLFNILEVSQDAVLLRVFPFTLIGSAKRYVDRLTPGAVNTWDLLKKAFIQRNISSSSNTNGLVVIVHRDTTLVQIRPPYGEKRPSLEKLMNKHQEESARRSAKMEKWIKKLQENAEINTRNQRASLKNLEIQIEQLTKELHSRTTNGSPSPSNGLCKVVNTDHEMPHRPISSSKLNNLHRVSEFQGAQNEEERTTKVLQCQLPPKELNTWNFTLLYTIGNFNFYGMADL